MLKEKVSVDDVCNLLNELLELDPICTHSLLLNRSICNNAVAEHSTIQVQQNARDLFPSVGLIGFLNGLFGVRVDGMGPICVEMDDGKILKFKPTPINKE